MLSGVLVTGSGSCRILLPRARRGLPSSILTLQLSRWFHRQKLNACRPVRYVRNTNGIIGLRYATTQSPPSLLLSKDAVAHLQSLLSETSRGTSSPGQAPNSGSDNADSFTPSVSDLYAGPLGGALLALQMGDTRTLLIQLKVLERMSREELQEAIAGFPRNTFTELFRALDLSRVVLDCDPNGFSHIPPGMVKKLNMFSSVDDWGVRRLYTRLLRRLLPLMSALQTAGHTLHMDEYMVLIRCASACGDLAGAKAIWQNMISGPALAWRNSETYTEYIKARFLTEPLYTSYQKTTRMVTPRNLHRSRLQLPEKSVERLDGLRLMVRAKMGLFGLNKEISHVEELTRALRGQLPAVRLFRTVIETQSFRLTEQLICAVMIALARDGSLRLIGTHVLERYFGIRTPHPFPPKRDSEGQKLGFSLGSPRIRPTTRLMRAIVEAYGSNAEISVAIQLIEHLSSTHNLPIPRDVWQDLLEWTYIMSVPPASTAWEIAKLHQKIPSPQAVEMVFNTMTSAPYNLTPSFGNYNILIRSLIGRYSDDLTPVLAYMREATALYHEHCREYEVSALEHLQHLRHGLHRSAVKRRFQVARSKKQRMWYDISAWCRMLLKRIPFSKDSPVPNPIIPDFIREFRPFLRNPVEYLTPTGRVSLSDPLIETFRVVTIGTTNLEIPMKNLNRVWVRKYLQVPKVAVLSSQSLAPFKTSSTKDPMKLLAPDRDSFVNFDEEVPPQSDEFDESRR
ncbi:mitochondrial ATPase expression-domain-containing protein [Nemania sp. FL0031]|nr:mitochondrial ATPase expression-domain-containing protein [Nemania sp. FL0031]